MKTGCEEFSERIIFFDDLDEYEKEIVQSHLDECKNCRVYFDHVVTIMHSLKGTNHLSDEQLTRFIISENFPEEPDYDGRELSTYKAIQTGNHLRACTLCRERFEEMKVEFETLESFVSESIAVDLDLKKNVLKNLVYDIKDMVIRWNERWKTLLNSPQQKVVYISAAGIAVLLLLIWFLPILTNSDVPYSKLGRLENTEITFLTRSAGVDNLQQSISDFNTGNYSLAVDELESFILEHPEDPNKEIAQYVCGLAYLFLANSVDEKTELLQDQSIEKGIRHLQAVLSISVNKRFQEGCNWYIGKAYLMKKDKQTAIEYFTKVQNSKGRKAQKAKEILAELKN